MRVVIVPGVRVGTVMMANTVVRGVMMVKLVMAEVLGSMVVVLLTTDNKSVNGEPLVIMVSSESDGEILVAVTKSDCFS